MWCLLIQSIQWMLTSPLGSEKSNSSRKVGMHLWVWLSGENQVLQILHQNQTHHSQTRCLRTHNLSGRTVLSLISHRHQNLKNVFMNYPSLSILYIAPGIVIWMPSLMVVCKPRKKATPEMGFISRFVKPCKAHNHVYNYRWCT